MNTDRHPHDAPTQFEGPDIHEQNYLHFLSEAQDLLQSIEHDLLTLKSDRSPVKIHSLMRSVHTLKGAAASVHLETIKEVSHVLEDIFKALYNPDVEIDAEIESLLFEGYECLRMPLMAEFTGGQIDESDTLNRAASIIAKLQEKLGDAFDPDAPIPSSVELGFDVVQSMFEAGVAQRLQTLRELVNNPDSSVVEAELRSQAEVLLGLAQSVSLVGFAAIAQTILDALDRHPDQVHTIAQLAVDNLTEGQVAVLAGDRTEGGQPYAELQDLAQESTSPNVSPETANEIPPDPDFLDFLQDDTMPNESDNLDLDQIAGENISVDDAYDINVEELVLDELEAELTADITNNVSADLPEDEADRNLDAMFENLDFPDDELESLPSVSPDAIATPVTTPATTPVTTTEPQPNRSSKSLSSPSKPQAQASPSQPSASQNLGTSASAGRSSATPVAAGRSLSAVRVDLKQLERLNHFAGELLINQNQQTTQGEQLHTTLQALTEFLEQHQHTLYEIQDWADQMLIRAGAGKILNVMPAMMSPGRSPTASPANASALMPTMEFDSLEMDRYSDLHVLSQTALNELAQLEHISESLEQVSKTSRRTLKTQQRLLTNVRDDLTNARMRSVGEVFNRLPPVLNQLTSTYGKQVELLMSGTDVLVDKAIAEQLYDPLLHLLRNAFDHGIEDAQTRQSQGKHTVGRIEIHAYHQGNRTLIDIRDDGRGVDLERVLQQAIDLDFVSPEDAARLSTSQVLEFLFESGFSTSNQVSDLSGRGVGLDVVRSQLHRLKGDIAIQSIPQQGTTFTLQIPFSLTITKLLVYHANGISYALPVDSIERVLLPQSQQLRVSAGQQQVIIWHQDQQESLIPVYKLSDLLHYPTQLRPKDSLSTSTTLRSEAANPSPILMLRTAKGLYGLVVDHILGEQELVIRPLGEAIAPPPYVYGCCILGDSRLALAVDPELLTQSVNRTLEVSGGSLQALPKSMSRPSLPAASSLLPVNPNSPLDDSLSSQVLLVVDDSLTLRQALTYTLEQAGYDVVQAKDGQEALDKLQHHPQVSLVVCDVEMPRMNGFEFLNESRQNPSLSEIPVVMLTSRSGDKHRQIALALGASAYVTKPYSDKGLLSTLQDVMTTNASLQPPS